MAPSNPFGGAERGPADGPAGARRDDVSRGFPVSATGTSRLSSVPASVLAKVAPLLANGFGYAFWIALGLTAATIVLALLLLRSGDRGPAGRFLLTGISFSERYFGKRNARFLLSAAPAGLGRTRRTVTICSFHITFGDITHNRQIPLNDPRAASLSRIARFFRICGVVDGIRGVNRSAYSLVIRSPTFPQSPLCGAAG